jgi:ribosomal protein S18 acetylase RimI-like enzyme/2-polyprenyl-3-methyl-5-hydroxy-6-metoxy-1,4-benzoquinol methylase
VTEPVLDRRWTPGSAARRFAQVARDEGPRRLWLKAWGEHGYRRLVLVELPPGVPASTPFGDGGEGLDPGALRDGEVPVRPGGRKEEVRARLAAGHTCFAVRRDGVVVATCWVARGALRSEHLGLELPLQHGEALLYEVYTAPSARSQGVATAMLAQLARVLRADGVHRILALVDPENDEGRSLFTRLGFRRAGTVRSAGLGGRRYAVRWSASGLASRAEAWDRAAERVMSHPYLDAAMAEVKRRAHLDLLDRWLPSLEDVAVLKTDLWEEAVAGDELLFSLARRARSAAGVDVSPRVVAAARERAATLGIDVTLEPADVLGLPFGDGAFGAVVSTSTLDHLDVPAEHRAALVELRRVLVPGGTLVVSVDNNDNATDPLLRVAEWLGRVPFPLRDAPSLDELRALLTETGFDVRDHAYVVPAPRVLATVAVRAARSLPGGASAPAVAGVMRGLDALGRRWPRRVSSFVAVLATAR